MRRQSPSRPPPGQTIRHRLNRGGDRQANNALWRIATTRMRCHQPTIEYTHRRQTESKTRREIIRCLKRHIAREIYHLLTDPPPTPNGAHLRTQRHQHRSPSPTPPPPSTPTPTASHNSKEASTTTTTSPPNTNTGSPNKTL